MAVVRIIDAPFTKKEKRHLILMGIVEADWGHPQVVLDNPIEYFRERVRLKDDPTLQMKTVAMHLPSMRGRNLQDEYRRKVLHNPDAEPVSLRVARVEVK